AAKELRVRQAPAAGDRERRAIGPDPVHLEAAGDGSRVPRILHPRDVEALTEVPQIQVLDVTLAGVVQRLLRRVDRSDGSRADRRAKKLREREGRAALDERLTELSGHVVVEGQQTLDVRHRN